MSAKATPFLMFSEKLGEAVELYTSIFPNSSIHSLVRDPTSGTVQSAEFTVGAQRFMAYNGGPHFKFSHAFSIFIRCENQAEVDLYWNALLKAGATPLQCGWITDAFGLSWQIVPRRFMELMADSSPHRRQAVMAAMLNMVKFDVEKLEQAANEASKES